MRLEDFSAARAGHVRMYVCGITVYDYCHVGHARFMTSRSTWCSAGCGERLRVTYVRNITDIDDKIIRARSRTARADPALTDAR